MRTTRITIKCDFSVGGTCDRSAEWIPTEENEGAVCPYGWHLLTFSHDNSEEDFCDEHWVALGYDEAVEWVVE